MDISEYLPKSISKDLLALLDLLELDKVVSSILSHPRESAIMPGQVVIGHDWGSFMAWRFVHWFPERVKALATFVSHFPFVVPELMQIQLVKPFPSILPPNVSVHPSRGIG
jgi:pimeloyl-ACP methyl ester carboxylesterase